MAFSDFRTDYKKRLELHKQKGAKSNLSVHQIARIMDGIKIGEREDFSTEDVLLNLKVCLN